MMCENLDKLRKEFSYLDILQNNIVVILDKVVQVASEVLHVGVVC